MGLTDFSTFITTRINKITPPIHYGILTFSLLAVLNPLGFLPLGLGSVWSYFLFFYLGFCIKQQFIKLPLFSKRNSLLAVSIFVISFVGFMLIREYWPADNVLGEKLLRYTISGLCRVASSLSAIFFIYGIANKAKVIAYLKSKPILITLSGYCYGIYIYQQFILQILYYKTPLPSVINVYWLPWVAILITLFASLLLCHLTLKFKFGRYLIG